MNIPEQVTEEIQAILNGREVDSNRFNEIIKEFTPNDLIKAFLEGKVAFNEDTRWSDNALEQLKEILNQRDVSKENIKLAWYFLLAQLEDGESVFYWREALEALLDHYNCPKDVVTSFAKDFLIELKFEDTPWWQDLDGVESYEMEDYLDNLFNACISKVKDDELEEELAELYEEIVEYRSSR